MDDDASVGRLESEDEDAVEGDRQRAEERQPARPAVDSPDRRIGDPDQPLEVAVDPRRAQDLNDCEDDRRGGEPGLEGNRRREDLPDDVRVLRRDVEDESGQAALLSNARA